MNYEINEAAARTAHNMNSMREYRPNQTTDEYRREVLRAQEIADKESALKPEYAEELSMLLDRYARKLADWYNESSRIEAMCPSIMISGAGNFPVRKKEKQNQRRDSHMKKYADIQSILSRMQSIGTGGIKSNDEKAVEKLTIKLEGLEEFQETMKNANAYYRKLKTLDGCPGLDDQQVTQINENMARSSFYSAIPFPPFALSNNSANIRRTRDRLEELKKRKAIETHENDIGIDGVKVVENSDLMRVQFIFDENPNSEVRDTLKGHGFKWAPSQNAWQRQLTNNGIYAAKQVIAALRALSSQRSDV
ncbi:hypothetical protein LJC33_06545 [Eubacteriales bacterium OttesenSCG-928-N13]|nr:hypothetical protein [Eubacteriales bacterium OttesenSCG-928-N13]